MVYNKFIKVNPIKLIHFFFLIMNVGNKNQHLLHTYYIGIMYIYYKSITINVNVYIMQRGCILIANDTLKSINDSAEIDTKCYI